MASYFPISNLLKQKRLFNPYNERENALDDVDTSTPNLDSLSQHVSSIPDREDYRLGTKDKILNAIVGGLTGFTSGAGKALDVTRANNERPYREALESWGLKRGGLEDTANIESRQINSRLRDAQLKNDFYQKVDELDQRRDHQEQTREQNQRKLEETVARNNDIEENTRLTREQTKSYQSGMVGAANKRAEASMINANRPRTGNTPQPKAMYNNPNDATEAAIASVIEEEPGIHQYLDQDTNEFRFRRDRSGQIVKPNPDVPNENAPNAFIPLDDNDKRELDRIDKKIKAKTNEFLTMSRKIYTEQEQNFIDNFEFDNNEEDYE